MMFSCPLLMSGTTTGVLDDFESFSGGTYPDGWSGSQRGSVGQGSPSFSGNSACYIGTNSSGSGTLMNRSFAVSGFNRVRVMIASAGFGANYNGACSMTLNGSGLSLLSVTASGVGSYYELLFSLPGDGTLNVAFDGYQAVNGSLGQGTGAQVLIDHLELVNR